MLFSPMAPITHPMETVASPVENPTLETSLGLNFGRELLDTSNEGFAVPPTTPEKLRVQRDRQMFQKVFDENMKNKPVKHDKGYVLLLSWEDDIDDLKVKDEVEQLEAMFTDQYGFSVTWKKLGKHKPKRELNLYLSAFMHDHDVENTLLIIYYAGHGVYENNSVRWQATYGELSESEKRSCIAWSGAENNITGSEADVLVIFDCCQAGGFGGHKVRSSRANFEFIAACGEKERTKRPGKDSFTSALMWSLEQLRDEAPFTSITLVEKIKDYKLLPKSQNPELLRRDEFADGLVWISPLTTGSVPAAVAKSEHRNPHHEYIDLRLNFYRRVELDDARGLARHLSRLVNNEESFAKHITLLDISSTFMKAITIMRKSSMGKKRKSISHPTVNTHQDSQVESERNFPHPAKRQRHESMRTFTERGPTSDEATTRDALDPLGASHHFRMFFHCSLQSLGSSIERIANQIHSPTQRPLDMSESLRGAQL